jgi:hypothetical protein
MSKALCKTDLKSSTNKNFVNCPVVTTTTGSVCFVRTAYSGLIINVFLSVSSVLKTG